MFKVSYDSLDSDYVPVTTLQIFFTFGHLNRIYDSTEELPIASNVSKGLNSRKSHINVLTFFIVAMLLDNKKTAWLKGGILSGNRVLSGQESRHCNRSHLSCWSFLEQDITPLSSSGKYVERGDM